MKNERALTTGLEKALKAAMPNGEWTKHSDRFTAGIPDGTWAWEGPTSWLEAKRLKPGEDVLDALRPGQLAKCLKLERATNHCWFVSYEAQTKIRQERVVVYRPSLLVKWPCLFHLMGNDVNGLAWTYTHAIMWNGFDHHAVARFIRENHEREGR